MLIFHSSKIHLKLVMQECLIYFYWNYNIFAGTLCFKIELKFNGNLKLNRCNSATKFELLLVLLIRTLKFRGHLACWCFCYRERESECISQDEFVHGLLLPAAGDAREKSPAEKTRKTEDDGGMFNPIPIC